MPSKAPEEEADENDGRDEERVHGEGGRQRPGNADVMCEDRMTKYSFLTVGLSGSVPAHFDPDLILDAIKCPRGPSARLVPYCLCHATEYLNFLADIVSKWVRGAPKESSAAGGGGRSELAFCYRFPQLSTCQERILGCLLRM